MSAGLVVVETAVAPTPASAAPGDPFSPQTPTVFIAQGSPSQLQRAETTGDGTFVFADEGGPAAVAYNAIAFNPADNYIYGMVITAAGGIPRGALVRIGQEGSVTRVGTTVYTHPATNATNSTRFYSGAFNPADGLYYVSDFSPVTTMLAINVSTGAVVRTINLGQAPDVQDFAFKDGFAWGANIAGDVRRINVATGAITTFPRAIAPGAGGYGAVWSFGNGNLGFSANSTGAVLQVRITNPASATPTFTTVSNVPGPSSNLNDGTSIPGLPTDLAILKSGPATFLDGDRISYNITVTNNGAGTSSGWTVTDTLPAGLSNPSVTGTTAQISGSTITASGGRLAVGESATFTVSADTAVAPGACLQNTATVVANELDNVPANNQSTAESCALEPALDIEKTSDATADSRPGDVVTYTVTATNTGTGDYTANNPAVVFDDLAGVLDDATFNDDAAATQTGDLSYQEPLLSWSGPLAIGASVAITYTVTLGSGGDGEVRNVAWQPGDPGNPTPPACDPPDAGGLDPETGQPCATTQLNLPKLSIDKIADRTDLPAIGEQATYTVTVTNEGPGDYTAGAPATMTDDLTAVLDDATIDEGSFTASVGAISYTEPQLSWSGVLAAGESATISYSVTYTGAGDQILRNLACVPVTEVVAGQQACDTVQIPGSDLNQRKSVQASDDPVVAGSQLTYTLFFENDGPAAADVDAVDFLTQVLDDADVTVEPASSTLTAVRTGDRIDITGSVASGQTATVTYTVTIRPDGQRGDDLAANFLFTDDPDNPPVPPTSPVCEPEDVNSPDCTSTAIAAVEYVKTVSADTDPVGPGTVLTYTVEITSTGAATVPVSRQDVLTDVLDDARVQTQPNSDTASVTVTEIDPDRFTIGGELAGGQVATVTYQVVVNDLAARGNNSAANFLVPPGQAPPAECVEGSTECTVTPLSNVTVVKSVDPASGTTVVAGQDLTYTLTFTNSGQAAGEAAFDDVIAGVLDDATISSAPAASDAALTVSDVANGRFSVSGTLAAGQTVTVTYTATVNPDGERGDNVLGNFVTGPGEEPPAECVPGSTLCTSNPVPEVGFSKSVQASTTPVAAGTELTYTLTFENTGTAAGQVDTIDYLAGVLDDADVTSEPTSDVLTAQRTADQIAITGELPAGATTTVVYTVTVKADADRGDNVAANFLRDSGDTPPIPGEACQPADDQSPDCTATPIGLLLVTKAVTASTSPVEAGTVLTYTLTFDNQGQATVPVDETDTLSDVLDDATLLSEPESSDAALAATTVTDDAISITDQLAAGQTVTVTYQVTVNDPADRGNNSAANFVAPTGQEPPATCEPTDPRCTVTPLPNVDVVKTVDPASGTTVVAGQALTYTLTFTNSGQAAGAVSSDNVVAGVLDDADVTAAPQASSDALTASAITDGRFQVTGSLAAGQTETVSYTVTVKADGDRGDNVLGNFVTDPGAEPPAECEPGSTVCTVNPIPEIEDWKTVAPATGTPVVAGQELTYTLHFTNTGTAVGTVSKVDDLTHVLDDADVTTEPVATSDSWTVGRDAQRISIQGDIAPGETVTVAYTVTVKASGDRGDEIMANFLLDPDTAPPADPVCEAVDGQRADCTVNPVGDIRPSKSVDPESGTAVKDGQKLTYTLSFENTGQGAAAIDYVDHMAEVLDDATLAGDITTTGGAQVSGPLDGQLLVSGTIQPGETATVVYTVTIKAYADQGDHGAANFLTVAGQDPPAECTPDNPLCTDNPIPAPPASPGTPGTPGLAWTGAAGLTAALILALLLAAGGTGLVYATKRRRSTTAESTDLG